MGLGLFSKLSCCSLSSQIYTWEQRLSKAEVLLTSKMGGITWVNPPEKELSKWKHRLLCTVNITNRAKPGNTGDFPEELQVFLRVTFD